MDSDTAPHPGDDGTVQRSRGPEGAAGHGVVPPCTHPLTLWAAPPNLAEAGQGRDNEPSRKLRASCSTCMPAAIPTSSEAVHQMSNRIAGSCNILADVGKIWPSLANCCPTLPKVWRNSTKLVKVGRRLVKLSQVRPTSAKFDQCWPKLVKLAKSAKLLVELSFWAFLRTFAAKAGSNADHRFLS